MAWGTEWGIDGLERLGLAFKSCQLRLLHTTGIHDNLPGSVMPNTKADITERQEEYSTAHATRPAGPLGETLPWKTPAGVVFVFVLLYCSCCFFLPHYNKFFLKDTASQKTPGCF